MLQIAFLLFSGCDKNDNINEKGEIIPLKVGNYWTYSNHYFRSSDIESIDSAEGITYKIHKKVKLKNKYYFIFGFFALSDFGIIDKEGFWAKGSDILDDISLDEIIPDSLELLFKYPTKVGDKWFCNSYSFFYNTLITKKLNVKVNVPAGTFNCVHYQFKNLEKYPQSGFFVSPGIGMIKCEIIMGSTPKDTIWNILELTKYKLN